VIASAEPEEASKGRTLHVDGSEEREQDGDDEVRDAIAKLKRRIVTPRAMPREMCLNG
jgi:hypothetical protein